MSEAKEANQRGKRMSLLFAFCFILLAGVIVLAVLFFTQNGKPDAGADTKKSEQIIKKVGKLYMLPGKETPTVAEIKDRSSLPKDQEFYKDAENGDFVLVYTQSKIALLYRDSINKLVRVSPVIPASEQTSQAGRSNGTP